MNQAEQIASPAGISVPELVRVTLAQACGLDSTEVSLESNLVDLNMDSLTLVSALAQLEALYELELTSDDMLELMECGCVSDLADRIEWLIRRERPG